MGQSRREFLKQGGATWLMRPSAQNAVLPRPNILWVMSDDHASHALSCYGSRLMRTPNLDRLANEGVRFQNAFCTNSLCAPARATLLTGKYSHKNGVLDNQLRNRPFDGSQITFPKMLQKAGYRTALIGKWHLASDPTGFHDWTILPGQGLYQDPVLIENGRSKTKKGYVTDIITDAAIRFIRRRDQPFCLMLHHKAPHSRWEPAEKYKVLFDDRELPEPPTFDDDYSHRASAATHADMRLSAMPEFTEERSPHWSPEKRKKWNYQRFLKDYLRTIASVDEAMGRLLAVLDDSGLARDTVVVYTSDNGVFLGDHGWFDKRFMYEQAFRIPLLVRYPRLVESGVRNDQLVVNVDFAPTILDLAGVAAPGDMQGKSLVPLLKGQAVPWRKSVYYRYYEYPISHRVLPHYGVRTDRYKLIHFPTTGEWELFDLKADPHELRSRYGDPAMAVVLKQLKAELEMLRAEFGDIT